jgi:tetratricopeptide (TPR) repeat protein/uncharacterized caspase-like protein
MLVRVLAAGLLLPLVSDLTALAQRPTLKRQAPPPPDRGLQVKEMSSGGALDGRGKLWAVVIGVSSYKNLAPKEQLEFAHRDAEEFAAFLRSPNGGGFPSRQLTLLMNQSATLSAMRSALGTTLPRSVEPDDMVVIFFAGHGVVEGEHDGYLLAYDSDPQNLYATALQISELNRIITERLKARTVILIADACHSGQLGWTSRGAGESAVLVNRYLDEVGKTGRGVFRLLASRADQRSYEDKRWGGGHGCFTWFLLEGLRGRADRDHDGFVRVGELLDFLSENVPKATQALQHPRAAGDIDTRLPMAVLASAAPKTIENVATPSPLVTLEVRGAPGLEVYLDNTFRGRVLSNGVLAVEQLKPGEHDLSVLSPNIEPINQKLSLTALKTILNVKGGEAVSSPLVAQIKQALTNKDVRGALDLYQQFVKQAPRDPQRASIEATLGGILESIGQNAINVYVQSSGLGVKRGMFHDAAEAFRLLKLVAPNADRSVEAKLLFCEGKAKFEDKQFPDAIERFNRALTLDPRAAYTYSAIGMAYRNIKKDDQALDAFKRAAELAPSWALPQLQLGFLYRDAGKHDRAREAFQNAARFEPRYPYAQEQLMLLHLLKGDLKEAERLGNEIIGKFPNSGYAHLWLGQIYEQSDRWALAVASFEKGLSLLTDINPEQRADFMKRLEKCRKRAKG